MSIYKTVVYCRLSREDGDKAESNSIASQRAICEDYISKQTDMKVVMSPLIDDGFSGVNFERPSFEKLKEAIKNGSVNCIICKDLSRFSRNYIDAGRYLEKLFPQLGVRFVAIGDNYDSLKSDSGSDAFLLPFKNLMNDTFCKDISAKIRSSLGVKRKNGQYVGCFCPYGYEKSKENRNQLIIDENAKETVQMIFSLFKDGMSIGRIVDRLNQMGILSPMEYKRSQGLRYDTAFKTSDTAKWVYSSVQRILCNEVYIGVLAQGKRSTPNHKVRVMQEKDETEWIKVENTHEALVSYDDFMAVKELMKRDMRCSEGNDENFLFSGFLFCPDCGSSMIRKTVPSKTKKYVYYVCSKNKKGGGCKAHSISVAVVEDKVFRAIHDQVELIINLEKALALIDDEPYKDKKILNSEVQLTKLIEEVERYQKLKLRLYEDFKDGIITKDDYLDFRKSYTQTIGDKQESIKRVKREQQQAITTGITKRNFATLFGEYENIEKLSRRVLISLVDRILIHENKMIEIVFKYQDEYIRTLEYITNVG